MSIVKLCLLYVIILQYTQFSNCQPNEDAMESASALSPRPGQDGLQRTPRSALSRCPGGSAACLEAHHRLPKINNKKLQRCRKRDRKCKKKRKRRCKNNLRCFLKKTKKCRKRSAKCLGGWNDRPKDPNDTTITLGPNGSNSRSPEPDPTTPAPRRKKDEECQVDGDCEPRHCCAQHRKKKICKEMIPAGKVCQTPLTRKRRAPFFERCPCAPGLYCEKSTSKRPRHFTCQIAT